MNIPNLDKDPTGITYLNQLALQKLGFYKGKLDNWRGGVTDAALESYQASLTEPPTEQHAKHMARSAANIATLHPKLQPIAMRLVDLFKDDNLIVVITSGSRTYEQQRKLRELYLAGKGGKAAPAGYSNHNFGTAFDVTLFPKNGSDPEYEDPKYKAVGEAGKALGLTWGGRWRGEDEDPPHFELRPKWAENMSEANMVAELRRRHDVGIDPYA